MTNVRELIKQLDENWNEVEQLSAEESEDIAAGAATCDIGCLPNTSCPSPPKIDLGCNPKPA